MTTLKGVKQAPTAAALKAERERDKAQAVRDYEEERRESRASVQHGPAAFIAPGARARRIECEIGAAID